MNWLNNLKLRTKLTIGFSLVLLLTICLGATAINRLAAVNAETEEISKNWLPSVSHISDMNTDASDFRVAEYAHILAQTEQDMSNEEKTLETVTNNLRKNQAVYEPLIEVPPEFRLPRVT